METRSSARALIQRQNPHEHAFITFQKSFPATAKALVTKDGAFSAQKARKLVAHFDLAGMALGGSKDIEPLALLSAYCKLFGDILENRVPL